MTPCLLFLLKLKAIFGQIQTWNRLQAPKLMVAGKAFQSITAVTIPSLTN